MHCTEMKCEQRGQYVLNVVCTYGSKLEHIWAVCFATRLLCCSMHGFAELHGQLGQSVLVVLDNIQHQASTMWALEQQSLYLGVRIHATALQSYNACFHHPCCVAAVLRGRLQCSALRSCTSSWANQC